MHDQSHSPCCCLPAGVDSVGNPTNNLDAPLWIASYTASPSIPRAWSSWTFWQDNDNGACAEVGGS